MPLEGVYLGRYRLIRLIGSGGMGEVYLAEDDRIAQQVAIKVIRMEVTPYPDTHSAKEATRLFEREARAIARLDHPNILPLYAYGEETVNDQTLTYLVMPYRKEGTLATWLRQRATSDLLSAREVAYLLTQAADALQHAHDQQILHQDIKPSNFLIRSRKEQLPDLLLADFGIAKFTTATASVSQSIRGTPTYMAPEQWDGHPVAATDQYALAIMAYELLTGRPPFQGGPGQVMRQHYFTLPEPPSKLNARLSSSLDAVLLRALAKQPEERFASIAAFAHAFGQAAQDNREALASAQKPSTPSADLHATLAISKQEALSGTRRTLTLPGGRRVTIWVPAGAQEGQVLRLEGQGELSDSGVAGALILTLIIAAAEASAPLADPRQVDEKTFLSEVPAVSSPPVTPSSPAAERSSSSSPPSQSPQFGAQTSTASQSTVLSRAAKRGVRGISRRQVLAGLAALAAAGGGLTWWVVAQKSPEGTLLYTYRGHSNTVTAVAWSPDGSRIASGSSDNTVQVWNATDSSNPYTYKGHSRAVDAVAWSPNGSRIASAGYDNTVQVWQAV
jgi:serine/threonine protein kinase